MSIIKHEQYAPVEGVRRISCDIDGNPLTWIKEERGREIVFRSSNGWREPQLPGTETIRNRVTGEHVVVEGRNRIYGVCDAFVGWMDYIEQKFYFVEEWTLDTDPEGGQH